MNKALAETCLRYLDGDLAGDELQAFNRLLVESPQAADLLSQLALDEQHYRATPAELEDDALAELLKLEAAAQPLAHDVAVAGDADEKVGRTDSYPGTLAILRDPGFWGYAGRSALRTRPVQWAGAAAAAVLLAVGLVFVLTSGSEGPQAPDVAGHNSEPNRDVPAISPAVATLTNTHNAQWADASAEGASAPGSNLRTGDTLAAGQRLNLTAGFAEITTNRGAVAIIQAPATIEFSNNNNAIHLHAGKLVGLCHTASSKGFVVKTDHATITDLGTEFGVDVRNDALQASVFVGEVRVQMPTGESKVITTNRTARISYTAGLPQLVVEDEIGQAYTRRTPRAALVTDASINLPDFEVNVLPQGVYEDVKLFTDREHQLNGIDQEGLPALLLGGDLIQMPADARPELNPHVGKRLVLEIDVSMPADIYLLIEVGTKVEPWVQEQYVKTPMRAGNDHLVQSDDRRLGVGPGISIDRTFEIWKRRAPVTERTTIGGAIDGTMYAVIAVPFHEAEATKAQ